MLEWWYRSKCSVEDRNRDWKLRRLRFVQWQSRVAVPEPVRRSSQRDTTSDSAVNPQLLMMRIANTSVWGTQIRTFACSVWLKRSAKLVLSARGLYSPAFAPKGHLLTLHGVHCAHYVPCCTPVMLKGGCDSVGPGDGVDVPELDCDGHRMWFGWPCGKMRDMFCRGIIHGSPNTRCQMSSVTNPTVCSCRSLSCVFQKENRNTS